VGNVAERGPLAAVGGPTPTFRKKFSNENVSGWGFLCAKIQNHREKNGSKLPKNSKKQLTENEKSTEYRNRSKVGAQILQLACQWGGSHPWTPAVTPVL